MYYIQTGVSLSDPKKNNNITIKFRAPIDTSNDENAAKEINYEAFKIEDEYKLLKDCQFEKYSYV